jgi:hypothetical protein
VAKSESAKGLLKVVIYHSKNGIRMKANVTIRIVTSHFLAIGDLASAGLPGAAAVFCGSSVTVAVSAAQQAQAER